MGEAPPDGTPVAEQCIFYANEQRTFYAKAGAAPAAGNAYDAYPNRFGCAETLGSPMQNTDVTACRAQCDGDAACLGFIHSSES